MSRPATLEVVVTVLAAFIAGSLAAPALAQWPRDASLNLAVCMQPNNQMWPVTVPDGAGGVFITWYDQRSASSDIYIQRIGPDGTFLWNASGVAVCTAAGNQTNPAISADGAGGCFLSWADTRSGTSTDLYAQHVDANGIALWAPDGIPLCVGDGNPGTHRHVSDGQGGVIIFWRDDRGPAPFVPYGQRLTAGGVPLWGANGQALCTDPFVHVYNRDIAAVADGTGGMILAWTDLRGADADIYGQRVDASGSLLWLSTGLPIRQAPSVQRSPSIVSDGSAGAIVTWEDSTVSNPWPSCGVNTEFNALRIGPTGSTVWPVTRVARVCAWPAAPTTVPDGAGGAIVAWQDLRGGSSYDIYAQKITKSGAVTWSLDGVPVCTDAGTQTSPTGIADGEGGVVLVWSDYRTDPAGDLYANRLASSGVLRWNATGRPVSTAPSYQTLAAGDRRRSGLTLDGRGGVVLTWYDLRNSGYDIYAQRLETGFGTLGVPEPRIASVRDVRNDQGGRVKVSWTASDRDLGYANEVSTYWLWRSVPPNVAVRAVAEGARMLEPGESLTDPSGSVFAVTTNTGGVVFWEFVGTQPASGFPGYSYTATTTSDSIPSDNPYTRFLVQARSTDGVTYWNSAPDSGYSVDNLAPAVPQALTGTYRDGSTALHWLPNAEADLAGYRLYRGTTAGFVPGPASFVAALADTGHVDAAGSYFFYKLKAIDLHGNEGAPAVVAPVAVDVLPVELSASAWWSQAAPNPARGDTQIRVHLPQAGRVTLQVFDARGRQVRRIERGNLAVGWHAILWDGHDGHGRSVGAGLYHYRLNAGGTVLTGKMVRTD